MIRNTNNFFPFVPHLKLKVHVYYLVSSQILQIELLSVFRLYVSHQGSQTLSKGFHPSSRGLKRIWPRFRASFQQWAPRFLLHCSFILECFLIASDKCMPPLLAQWIPSEVCEILVLSLILLFFFFPSGVHHLTFLFCLISYVKISLTVMRALRW